MPATAQDARARSTLAVGLTIAIVDLALITAYIHLTLGGTLFTLNALGYVALAAAIVASTIRHPFVRRFAWLPRVGLAGYAAVTIVAYLVVGPYFSLGWVAKGIEVAIIALVAADLVRLYGSPAGLVSAALRSLRIGAEPVPSA
jgi:uncharacterized membrane protein YeiB